jgi:hypothetical protein
MYICFLHQHPPQMHHPSSCPSEFGRYCVQRPLWYPDADALTRSRRNDLGGEVTARLREEWGKLGKWRGSYPDYEGLAL